MTQQLQDLQQAYLFQGLVHEELERVTSAAGKLTREAGEYVYRKGEPGAALYLITEGKVELIGEKPDGASYVAGHISAGGMAALMHIVIVGGLLCSLYAVYKILQRMTDDKLTARHIVLPYLFLFVLGWSYLTAI